MIPLPSLTGGRSREHSHLAKASVENIISKYAFMCGSNFYESEVMYVKIQISSYLGTVAESKSCLMEFNLFYNFFKSFEKYYINNLSLLKLSLCCFVC